MSESTAAVIRNDLGVLFLKRRPGGDLGNLWELPGGKVDEGENHADALRRELAEELGVDVEVGEQAGIAAFSHGGVEFTLYGYFVSADVTGLELREHEDLRWYTLDDALLLELAPSDRALITDIIARS